MKVSNQTKKILCSGQTCKWFDTDQAIIYADLAKLVLYDGDAQPSTLQNVVDERGFSAVKDASDISV